MEDTYTITINDLLKRPLIRDDQSEEWLNKMTDAEIYQFDKEARVFCLKEGVEEKFPDLNSAHLTKHIDRTILYNLFKLGDESGKGKYNKKI